MVLDGFLHHFWKPKHYQIAKTQFLRKPEKYWFSNGKIDIFKVSKVWNLNEHRSKNSKNWNDFWISILSRFGTDFGRVLRGQKPGFLQIFEKNQRQKIVNLSEGAWKPSRRRKKQPPEPLSKWEPDQGDKISGQVACWGGRGGTTIKQQAYYLTRPWAKGPANFFGHF